MKLFLLTILFLFILVPIPNSLAKPRISRPKHHGQSPEYNESIIKKCIRIHQIMSRDLIQDKSDVIELRDEIFREIRIMHFGICAQCGNEITAFLDKFDRIVNIDDMTLLINCYERDKVNFNPVVFAERVKLRAHLAYKKGRYSLSVSDYRKVISILGQNSDSLFWLGKALYYTGEYEEALTCFWKCKNNSISWQWIAATSSVLGNVEVAEIYYKKTMKDSISLLADLYLETTRFSDAIPLLLEIDGRVAHRKLGVAFHMIGDFSLALSHFNLGLKGDLTENEDYAAFYSREFMVYCRQYMDAPFNQYMDLCVNGFPLPLKNGWSHMKPPKNIVGRYSMAPMEHSNFASFDSYDSLHSLVQFCQRFAKTFHVHTIGFKVQIRQIRSMGFGVLDLAQELNRALLRGETLKWRDVFDILVKWRSVAGRDSAVFWSDGCELDEKTTRSRTYIIKGLPVTRYYTYYKRGFSLLKEILKRRRFPLKSKEISLARDLVEIANITGESSYYAETVLESLIGSRRLRGTGWVWEKTKENKYNFSILTIHRKDRWKAFEDEIAAIWSVLWNKLENNQKVVDNVLKIAYYWYNFMPLSRGSAGVGIAFIQGVFLSCGIHIDSRLPKDVQLDWEALLTEDPSVFVERARSVLGISNKKADFGWKELPLVTHVMDTPQKAVLGLNYAVTVNLTI